jgi:SAM-dependent methyltransferase
MHDTAYKIGGLVMETYLPSVAARILEIGAQNVNGTLRDHSPRNAEYIGLDFEAGNGVDVVITGVNDWNVPDAHFDLVMASSVFEHDKAFWRTFIEMCRKVKSGGHIYISAPSNGLVHRFPKDYWRFYPDSGLALEELARGEGFDLTLIESFIAERDADLWNDFCAVFRRGPSAIELNRDFVHAKVRCTNALNWRSSLIANAADDSEDMRLLRQAREEVQHASARQGTLEGRLAELAAQKTASEEHLHVRIGGLTQFVQERDRRLEEQSSQLQALTREVAKEQADAAALQRSSEGRLAELAAQRTANEESLQERINGLTGLVRERDQRIEEQDRRLEALNTELVKMRAGSTAPRRSFEIQLAELAAEKATTEDRLQERFREIGGLTQLIQVRDQHFEEQRRQLEALTTELAKEQAHSTALHGSFEAQLATQKATSEDRLQERFREISGLTRLIQERDQRISGMQMQVEWLCRVISVLTKGFSTSSKARALAWIPAYFAQKRQKASLREQGLFDAADYIDTYPDVLAGKADPLRHYINHGIKEGRVIKKGVRL